MTRTKQTRAIEPKNGPWKLADLDSIPKHGHTVFSCFHCGGGSSMGYKLAGFDVLGGVEIDPEMMGLYKQNHHPAHSFLMGVKEFNQIPNDKIPKELFGIDILDGSPPCSLFSMAGEREKKWGVLKKFREGQAEQILDDLFFDFIETAKKLQPKVVVAENVKGLVSGNARGYVKEILTKLNAAGYDTQIFLLNSCRMGCPQKRERVFFVGRHKGLSLPEIKLKFDEPVISVKQAWADLKNQQGNALKGETIRLWQMAKPGQSMAKVKKRGKGFNNLKVAWDGPAATVATAGRLYHPKECRMLSNMEVIRLQTFPDDYDFGKSAVRYVCGMSVPPYMMQRIALELFFQWFGAM